MTTRRILALFAIAGLALTLVACGGSGGSKKNATRTPGTRTPAAARTIAPTNTLAPGETAAVVPTQAPSNSNGSPSESDGGAPQAARVSGQSSLYRVTIAVASDPGNLRPLVEGRRGGGGRWPSRLTIIFGDNGEVMLSGQQPFINATGTIDGAGNVTAKGGGSVGDYNGVEATFTGTVTPQEINGSYAIGTNGALPGGLVITYSIVGTNSNPIEGTQQPQQQ